MKTGLFFGTFNPIHYGHLIIAQYFINHTDVEKICFIVSPHNPLKSKQELINANHRLEMTRLAISGNDKFEVSDIEFHLPLPSYTVQTLKKLKTDFTEKEFIIIMGSDSLYSLNKWRDFQFLLENFQLYIYPRFNFPYKKQNYPKARITLFEAPMIGISATEIRNNISVGKSNQYLAPLSVIDYLKTI